MKIETESPNLKKRLREPNKFVLLQLKDIKIKLRWTMSIMAIRSIRELYIYIINRIKQQIN